MGRREAGFGGHYNLDAQIAMVAGVVLAGIVVPMLFAEPRPPGIAVPLVVLGVAILVSMGLALFLQEHMSGFALAGAMWLGAALGWGGAFALGAADVPRFTALGAGALIAPLAWSGFRLARRRQP